MCKELISLTAQRIASEKLTKPHYRRRSHPLAIGCVAITATLSTCQAFTFLTGPLKGFIHRQQSQENKWEGIVLTEGINRPRQPSWRRLSSKSQEFSDATGDRKNATSSYFTPEQISELKESVSIIDVIESYDLPKFQRRGDRSAVAICPFHDDRNPSMNIDDKRMLYKCFSCGAGGDVFNFVREYSALQGEQTSYYQAIRHVAQTFSDGNAQLGLRKGQSRMSDDDRKALDFKKQRLRLINGAAAAYFGESLISFPAAGQARTHLRTRGLTPSTVRAFALGYAPDCYFGVKGNKIWGQGSLVFYLKDLGFTPDEIIESGLATQTKRAETIGGEGGNTTEEAKKDEQADYTTLIDRFRGRIMVPIFDAHGKNVIAFGGRTLPSQQKGNENSDYKVPKYLNSPESLVFYKTDELFGLHIAKEAVQNQKLNAERDSQRIPGSVVIVEGYMDVIRLWEANIKESVACMGTALTMEQLASAAKVAGTMGGRIILCLDSDEAGITAVERVCCNTFLAKTSEKYVVEILVATLPVGIKDPADFFEAKKRDTKGGENFRDDVLRKAEDWTIWYLKRILCRYNEKALRGAPGSFGDMCDRVSEFLATFPNPADRTKRAHDVADTLVDLATMNSGSREVSNSFRIQLQSDMVDMVSRKAAAKESIGRRIEAVDGFDPKQQADKLLKLSRGAGTSSETDDLNQLSFKAINAANPAKARVYPKGLNPISELRELSSLNTGRSGNKVRKAKPGNRQQIQRDRSKQQATSMTPHFQGFEFMNESDAEWLGLSRRKAKRRNENLVFGSNERYQKSMPYRFGSAYASGQKEKLVYFNSNEYHGKQFLTQEAIDTGYTNSLPAPPDRSFLQRGVATLIKEDPNAMITRGEEALLRNLVQYGVARSAIKTAMACSDATGSRTEIEWSCGDREWLFTYLVERDHEIPSNYLKDLNWTHLREYLACREDAPVGAFLSSGFTKAADSIDRHLRPDITARGSERARPKTDETATLPAEGKCVNIADRELQVSSDLNEIENWASSYDPTDLQDDFEIPEDLNIPHDLVSSIHFKSGRTDFGVIDTQAVSDDFEQIIPSPRNAQSAVFPSKLEEQRHQGSLDPFFFQTEDIFVTMFDERVSREVCAELEVQEALATLLKASALKRLEAINSNWLIASRLLSARLEGTDTGKSMKESPVKKSNIQIDHSGTLALDGMNTEDLQRYCQDLFGKLNDLFQTAHQLEVAWRRIKSRIFDLSSTDTAEGKIPTSKQDELFNMLDDFLTDLPQDWEPKEIDDLLDPNYILSMYLSDDPVEDDDDDLVQNAVQENLTENERFEQDMVMIDNEWAGWNDEKYRWSPGDSESSSNSFSNGDRIHELEADTYSNQDEESLDEAMARIDDEWGDWDNEEDDTDITKGSALSSRQQPLMLEYSNAKFGTYEVLQAPPDEAPSYYSEENEMIDLPQVVTAIFSEKGSPPKDDDVAIHDGLYTDKSNLHSVWE